MVATTDGKTLLEAATLGGATPSKVNVFSPVQFAKTPEPRVVSDEGNVIDVNSKQSENALLLIVVKFGGRVIVVKSSQK